VKKYELNGNPLFSNIAAVPKINSEPQRTKIEMGKNLTYKQK